MLASKSTSLRNQVCRVVILLLLGCLLPLPAAQAKSAPGALGKSAPMDGAQDQLLSLRLTWHSNHAAADYEYCVDTLNNDICDTAWESAGKSTSANVQLEANTLYYWQARARIASNVSDSDGGRWWSFKTGVKSLLARNPAQVSADSLMSAGNIADTDATASNYVQDSSFEASFPNGSYWNSWSQNFGTALCTLDKCGNGGGTARPRTGAVWVWFGGVSPQNEIAGVSQSVIFPSCGAKLQFYLWIGAATTGSDTNDRFVVTIDDQPVFTASATQKNAYRNYTLVSIDVHGFANGKAHLIKFLGSTSNQLVTFNLDDVVLKGCPIISGNAGTAGATLRYTGGIATADNSGNYSIRVPFGWTGTVTPSKASHIFSPASRQYTNVLSDQSGQNYAATRMYTISGNTSVGGVRLDYTNGAPKTIFSQANGNYSLTLPGGWTGILAPTHECFAFTPANQGYNNLASDHVTENYTPIFNSESGCADITAEIGDVKHGRFGLVAGASTQASFNTVNDGPVKIASSNGMPLIAAERLIYKVGGVNTSFSELMALPNKQLDTIYWLPWYNNNGRDLDTQLRFANVSTEEAHVDVFIGDLTVPRATYTLQPGESTRQNFTDVNDGPVKIVSDQDIVAAERLIYKVGGASTSFSEMMALPNDQVDKIFWLPWYNNSKDLDTQLRIANVTEQPTTLRLYLGTQELSTCTPSPAMPYPYELAAGESMRVSCAGVNAGPLRIESTQNIVAAERLIYKVNDMPTSFTETMALPNKHLDKIYWLPWYNNVGLDTQLRIANVTALDAEVTVTIGGTPMDPIIVPAGESARVNFPSNDGPVQIVSNQLIVAAERLFYKVNNVNTSFSEMMALPASQLDTIYWLPWYNNNGKDLDTQLRFGMP
jgi:hypothetical protein